jgi:hypothetical protein
VALAILAFFGIAGSSFLIAVVHAPPWVVAVVLGFILLVALEEGSFRAWTEEADRVATGSSPNEFEREVDAEMEWVSRQTVAVCADVMAGEEKATSLASICALLAATLSIWESESALRLQMRDAFPCYPKAHSGLYTRTDTNNCTLGFVVGAIKLLALHNLIDESRHVQSEQRARRGDGSMLVYGSGDASKYGMETWDTSFSEYRWTALGQAVARRLADQPSTPSQPAIQGDRDYESEVRAEISQLSTTAFRGIKLDQGEREIFEDSVFHACVELGWQPPDISINPVNLEHLEMGSAWKEGAFTIRSDDSGALRRLGNERNRIALQIRDSQLGRLFRENYQPKPYTPGILG